MCFLYLVFTLGKRSKRQRSHLVCIQAKQVETMDAGDYVTEYTTA